MSETDATSACGPGDGELPLSFEAWAELSARLATRTQDETFDILDEHDLELDVWQRCETHYALALADDIGHGRMERARAYANQCAEEMEKRRQASEAPSAVTAPEQVDVHVEEAPAPAPPQPRDAAVPSFLQPRDMPPAAIVEVSAVSAARPREDLAGTAMAFELPTAFRRKAAEALPFQDGPSPLNAATAPGSTSPLGPAPTAGATLGIGSDVLSQARSTLPFAKPTGGAPRVSYPRMPMQTYASFATELALFPEKAAEILHKYNVPSEASREALEQEWRARLEAHADTKAEWEAMVATYRVWLLQQPR